MSTAINWQEIPPEDLDSAINVTRHAREHGHPLPLLIGLDAWERVVSGENIGGTAATSRRLASLIRLARRNHNLLVQTGIVPLVVRRRANTPQGRRQTTRLTISLHYHDRHGVEAFVGLAE